MTNSPDSFNKVVTGYFAALTKKQFSFRGKIYKPKPLLISPLLFRGFTCPINCGACCTRVTLDFLPSESHPDDVKPRTVTFDEIPFMLLTDLQDASSNPRCRYLNLTNGRCGIHTYHPMLCDVELTKFIHYKEQSLLISKLFGRGWAYTRIDGQKGSMCEMLPATEETVTDTARKLKRIRDWCQYFRLDSWIDDVIDWVEKYPSNDTPLKLAVNEEQGLIAD